MKFHRRSKKGSKEAGQTVVLIALALGLFLLAAIAFSVDMGSLWFSRQMAQGVADSACTAAAMDMLYVTTGVGSSGGFTAGTPFSCGGTWDTAAPTSAPCVYAAKNMGSASSALTAGTQGYDLHFTFPSSVAGLPTCTSGKGSPAICIGPGLTNNFVQVNVDQRVPLFFSALLSGSTTTDVGAQATCGVIDANAPIPLLILNPTLSGTLNVSGTGNQAKITINGGPQRSIQVNSTNATAFSSNGNPIVDLSKGGPNNTGSDIGVTASESLNTSGIVYQNGQTGQWKDPEPPISDPFAQLPVPPKPGSNGTVTPGIAAGTNGCPTGTTCTEYTAGYYSTGISVKGATAIFDPGVYYLDGDFTADPNSCLRPSTAVGDSSGGTMFYFNTGTIQIDSNSGASCSAPISTTASSGTGQLQFGVKCTSKSVIPGNLPATISGNLLMAPCTGSYGDPLLTDDPIGEQHGILFFSNRSLNLAIVKPKDQPAFGGGGAAAALGSLYFHYCNSPDGAGLGSNCPTSAYTDQITLQGTPGSTSYVVGDIVTDELGMGGTPDIVMDLNPTALYYVLKASLLQ
jgi:hypothetical protein